MRGRLALPRSDARAIEEVGAARAGAGAIAMVVADLEVDVCENGGRVYG